MKNLPEELVENALEQVNSENTVTEIKHWLDQHHVLYQQSATKAQLLERVAEYQEEQVTNPDEEIDMGDTPFQPDEF